MISSTNTAVTIAARLSSRAQRSGGAVAAAAATAACSDATMGSSAPLAIASAQRADVAFEQRPGIRAELLLPLRVEARLAQRRAEQLGIGVVEHHALLR